MIDGKPLVVLPTSASRATDRFRKFVLFAALTAIIPVLFVSVFTAALQFVWVLKNQKTAANEDFASYWAAGKLLVHHKNPYDSQSAQALEKSVGYIPHEGITMRNPPFALPLVLPLGLLGIQWAAFIWRVLIVASIAATVHLVWVMHGRPRSKIHLLGFVFPAALCCFSAGQSSAFALLGVAGFLYFHKRNPFVAGVCIAFCAMKPHLFLPFAAVLLLWTLTHRAWPLILGMCAALATSLAISMPFHPALWSDYFVLLRTNEIGTEFVPVIGSLLRLAIDWNQMWIQFLPAPIGVIWGVWYFRRNRKNWDWRTHGSLLLLLSLLVAPYSWFFDEIILIPVMLHGIYVSTHRQRAVIGFCAISCIALMEMLLRVPITSGMYMWTTAAWLGWYLLETRQHAVIRGSEEGHVPGRYSAGDQILNIGT